MPDKGENRCTDSCGLFTAWDDLHGRTEYGWTFWECRWCRDLRLSAEGRAMTCRELVEESRKRRKNQKVSEPNSN